MRCLLFLSYIILFFLLSYLFVYLIFLVFWLLLIVALELKNDQKIDLGFDFWRVEAVVKKIKGDTFYLLDDEFISDFNPFDRLSFYDQYGFFEPGQGAYALFVYCAQAYGIDFACSRLDYKTRVKYLARLKQDMVELPFNVPAEIYKHCFKSVYIRFVNHLSSLFEKGQSLSLNNKKVR